MLSGLPFITLPHPFTSCYSYFIFFFFKLLLGSILSLYFTSYLSLVSPIFPKRFNATLSPSSAICSSPTPYQLPTQQSGFGKILTRSQSPKPDPSPYPSAENRCIEKDWGWIWWAGDRLHSPCLLSSAPNASPTSSPPPPGCGPSSLSLAQTGARPLSPLPTAQPLCPQLFSSSHLQPSTSPTQLKNT